MKKVQLCFYILLLAFSSYGQGFVDVTKNNDGQTINLSADKVLEIKLPRISSAGYIWCEVGSAEKSIQRSITAIGDDDFVLDSPLGTKDGKLLVGQSGTQIIRYMGASNGTTTLRLELRRPWEKNKTAVDSYTITVVSDGKYTGNYTPKKKELPKHVTSTPKSVPSRWDWRSQCTPVANQEYCGDCWAFATVGTLECNIKIHDGVTRDISEAFVTNCYTDNNCSGCNGGFCAHQAWLASYTGANSQGGGAVYEASCPWTTSLGNGTTGSCSSSGYTPHETIDSYADVAGENGYGIPPDANIKQAIYDYGPIWITVDASSNGFSNYSGGIFTESGSQVDHAVVLVGWVDSAAVSGGGYWILRNSWDTGWGINGYMYISYGSDLVGTWADYIVYKGGISHNIAPVANFSASVTSSCTGVVQFTDSSTNQPTSWLWNFGDGQTSTLQNPTHTYTTSGTFTVSLKAINSYGNNTKTITNYITINLPTSPTATGGSCSTPPCSVTLTATGSGTLEWYAAQTGGTPVATGTSYTTPPISTTTTYYVENDITHPIQSAGLAAKTSSGGYYTSTSAWALVFDVYSDLTIKSVTVYASGAANRTIWLKNSSGTELDSVVVNIPDGTQSVNLNFHVPAGTGYQLGTNAANNLWRDQSGAVYPYTLANVISITGNTAGSTATAYYYYFYNWQVQLDPCVSARVPVVATVSANLPSASYTVSSSTICQGSTISYTNTSTNATSYTWTFAGGTPASSTQINPTVTYNTPGTYNVTLVASNGLQQDTHQTTITVNATPVTTATASHNPICLGDVVALYGGGATNYTWDNGVLNGVDFTPQATAIYTVTGTNPTGCFSTAQIIVNVSMPFNLTASVTNASSFGASDGAIDLTITGGVPPYTVYWSNGANTEDLNNVSAGTYLVYVTNADGCITTLSVTVQQPNLVVSDIDAGTHIAVYPNPTNDNLTLSIRSENLLNNVYIQVYNNIGQQVLSKSVNPNKKDIDETISLNELAKGNYFIKVLVNDKQWEKNIIKK